jgi:hypothetical protein
MLLYNLYTLINMWPFLQTTNTNCDCEPASSNQCGCSKISSLDVAYSGPNLACSGIELCDSLSIALQKIEEKICTAGNISGAGILNYVARWTPNGNTLGTGLIQDDNNSVSIGEAPSAFSMLNILSNKANGITVSQSVSGKGIDMRSIIAGALPNWGFVSWAGNSTFQNIGADIVTTGGTTSTNIGIRTAVSGGATNYATQFQDGTEGIGKFLKSVTAQGHANWVNITTADITGFPSNVVGGSGTLNFLARWTPDGSTLGTGLIQDNGSTISIGTTLDPNTFISASTSKIAGIVIINENTTNVIRNAISASTNGISAAENRGIEALAMNSTLLNTGVSGNAISGLGADAVGGSFNSSGAGTNYSLQLRDGTQAVNKVLASMTSDGKSNWSKVTSNYTTGATGSFTSLDGKTITVTNGLIISIV